MLGAHPLLRDLLSPRAGKDRATDVYRQAGITDPRRARAPDGPAGHVRGRTAAKIALARPVRRSDRSLG